MLDDSGTYVHAVPASLTSPTFPVTRLYSAKQAEAAFRAELVRNSPRARFVAPPGSEYTNENVCVDPEPDAGATETTDGVALTSPAAPTYNAAKSKAS